MKTAVRSLILLAAVTFIFAFATKATGATSTIGILVFDGFLTSDVTAPIEVFGAATKKAPFSSYKVIVVSTTRDKSVLSEEGLRIIADKSIYDDLKLDVLVVPSSYAMDQVLKNKDLINFVKKQSDHFKWRPSQLSGSIRSTGEAYLR